MSKRMDRIGAAILVKKKNADAKAASGIKIFPCRDDGSPDYAQSSQIVWKADLDALLAGSARFVPVYLSPPFVAQQGGVK
jgi:hypothetical protein